MKPTSLIETAVIVLFTVLGTVNVSAEGMGHQMQHGFILSDHDTHGSHLVASGHHSRQTEIKGVLEIDDAQEKEFYQIRKSLNQQQKSYFLFQAQNLNLPTLSKDEVLTGFIVESEVGKYEGKNTIVKKATFKVEKIIINIENPFFKSE